LSNVRFIDKDTKVKYELLTAGNDVIDE